MLVLKLLRAFRLPVHTACLEKSWLKYTVLRHELKEQIPCQVYFNEIFFFFYPSYFGIPFLDVKAVNQCSQSTQEGLSPPRAL